MSIMSIIGIVLNLILFLIVLLIVRTSSIYWSWSNISGSLKRIYQNITRGWNDSDCWSLDYTIAKFSLPRLKRLKKMVHGHPGFDENDKIEYEDGMKKWKSIIDKMIYSFECILNDNNDIECPNIKWKIEDGYMKYDATEEEIKKHKIEMDIYFEKMKQRQKIIQEGLDLFAKYFQNLWD